MMEKGDFTAGVRLLWIAALAVVIGAICAFVALALLWLIGIFTHLFYFPDQFFHNLFHDPRALLKLESMSPGKSTLGWWAILVPALGGLIIGLMARYGSDRIRGHGIPEAIEAILIGRSRMSPKVAVLKPLSSAISIGSGGPFGAEGPIIMTGGAFGSIIAQAFHLTAAERKTLLVAGAAGGMSATFATPIAAVLLAVELLLFEWKPRSFIPVALASFVASLIRPFVLPFPAGETSLFPIPPHEVLGVVPLLSSAGCGLMAGLLALGLTVAVYAWEDAFLRLPIHWMWWPALGGLVVGVGGYFQPRALGVGYDVIRDLLNASPALVAGDKLLMVLLPLMLVKCWIWSTALGSGTSGGVLAPLLIMGGALGALLAYVLPGGDTPLWVLVSMAAVMGGTMRSPLTGTVFALELTHDVNALPALLIASVVAHGFTVLVMKRSILTEKVARRGYHVSREYSVDPLELLSVADVMTKDPVTVPASLPVTDLLRNYFLGSGKRPHQAYPVVDEAGRIIGVVTRTNVLEDWIAALAAGDGSKHVSLGLIITYDLIHREPITIYPWEPCRAAAERMAENGVGRLPVVSPDDPGKVIGIVTRSDLLKGRAKAVEEEMRRERLLAAPGAVPAEK
jgi:H+/Cl- antiporter ClcA/predicted transcriptional regulator